MAVPLLAAVASGQQAFSVAIDPAILTVMSSSVNITSGTATADVSGGANPYTYSWVFVGGQPLTINDDDAASTTFSTTIYNPGVYTSTVRLTVTDNVGIEAVKTLQINWQKSVTQL